MSGRDDEKKYTAFKIPREEQIQSRLKEAMERAAKATARAAERIAAANAAREEARSAHEDSPKSARVSGSASVNGRKVSASGQISFDDGLFFEMEINPSQREGARGTIKVVRGEDGHLKIIHPEQEKRPEPRRERITRPDNDPIRKRFYEMREIARQNRSPFSSYARAYDSSVQRENARIFVKQAEFMADFEDDYEGNTEFSSYFPTYQMMGYEQLRTYFTWRTRVRGGIIDPTFTSYAYIYMYELLNGIGAESPADGLDKLMSFRETYLAYDSSIDKYLLRWLKDYHIYYELPHTFRAFAAAHGLTEHYPGCGEKTHGFDFYCGISRYDIRKSVFFTPENGKMISDCAEFVIEKVQQSFSEANLSFDDLVFWPTNKLSVWTPFTGAVFMDRGQQPDKRVILSDSELYVCKGGRWFRSATLTSESGKRLIGFIFKRTESVLRKLTKYKYKLSAPVTMLDADIFGRMTSAGIDIEKVVESAATEFYREATKTVVTVSASNLRRIRAESLITQEALTVEEPAPVEMEIAPTEPEPPVAIEAAVAEPEPEAEMPDEWQSLAETLTDAELGALAAVLRGEDLHTFASALGVMPEVLADGINEKAADAVGDSLLDEEMTIYEDYTENVRGMVESHGK